jgi:iron complex transport system substrate-binding protein
VRQRDISATALLTIGLIFSTQPSAYALEIPLNKTKLAIVNSAEKPVFTRVVALAGGSAEIIVALGYKSILVGRDIASTMPRLSDIPIDTDAHQMAVERILSQKPDLIFIDKNSGPRTAIDTLKKAGIAFASVPDAYNLKNIVRKERLIARKLGVPEAGKMLAKKLSNFKHSESKIKVVFLYLRGNSAIYLIGGKGSGADSIISAIGFKDVGSANLKQPFAALSSEALIAMAPDVILTMTKGLESVGGISGLVKLPGVAQTPAGENRRVVTVDDSLLLSFGPRTGELLPVLRKSILKVAAR